MLSPPPAAATSTRASKAGIVRTIEPCCSSAIHHAWRLHSRLHLGRKCRLEKVALVVRRSEAAGWRWSSSTLNECKPRFLGVAVMHWAWPMAEIPARRASVQPWSCVPGVETRTTQTMDTVYTGRARADTAALQLDPRGHECSHRPITTRLAAVAHGVTPKCDCWNGCCVPLA